DLAPHGLLAVVVDAGVVVHNVLGTGGIRQLRGLGRGEDHDLAAAHGIRHKGQGFITVLAEQQCPLGAVEHAVGDLAVRQGVNCAGGHLQRRSGAPRSVSRGGDQHLPRPGLAQCGEIAA
ncbi:Terminase, partial [Dysosmobacter welbionis]